jgi:hypothetical protein
MKKYFFTLLFFISLLNAQVIYVNVIPESVETFTRNTAFILSSPENLNNVLAGPGITEEKEAFEAPAGQFGVSAETIFSMRNMYFNLPLRYRWKGMTAEVKLPVILKREIRYGDVIKSASGIGDAILRISYRFRQGSLLNESMIRIKSPTGKMDNTVDGMLVPLGSGSTDIILQNVFMMRTQAYSFNNSLSFRVNTKHERTVQIHHQDLLRGTETINYEISNGNLLILNSAFTYHFPFQAAVIGGASLSVNGEGSVDRTHSYTGTKNDLSYSGLSADQDFVFLDFYPALAYTILQTDLMICGRIPVLTLRNDSNTEDDRMPEIFFRLSRELF